MGSLLCALWNNFHYVNYGGKICNLSIFFAGWYHIRDWELQTNSHFNLNYLLSPCAILIRINDKTMRAAVAISLRISWPCSKPIKRVNVCCIWLFENVYGFMIIFSNECRMCPLRWNDLHRWCPETAEDLRYWQLLWPNIASSLKSKLKCDHCPVRLD